MQGSCDPPARDHSPTPCMCEWSRAGGSQVSVRFWIMDFEEEEIIRNEISESDVEELGIDEDGRVGKEVSGNECVGINRNVNLRLTIRDYEIFRFLLDQKFSSLEVLYYRFFDCRKSISELPPKEFFVARQRLGILKRAGLIKTQRVFSESKNLYLLSPMGFKALEGKMPDAIYAAPVKEVDFRSYDHDRRVNIVRTVLERQGKAVAWVSERRLRMQGFKVEGNYQELPKSIVPDGIFLSSKGERVALEVEASVRKKERFENKVLAFESVMSRHNPKNALIHKVLFVACTDAIGKELAEVLRLRADFILEPYEYFLGKLFSNTSQSKLKHTNQTNKPHSAVALEQMGTL